MSIVLTIHALRTSGALVPFEPIVLKPNHPQGQRFLWFTPPVLQWCRPPGVHPVAGVTDESLAALEDSMSAFARGEFVEDGVDIKRLQDEQRDVWEIRSHLGKPQLRMFGFFPLPKWFVATSCKLRSELEPSHGPRWEAEMKFAEDERARLIGTVNFEQQRSLYIRNPT